MKKDMKKISNVRKTSRETSKGFTLIELLVVISIIGVLSGMTAFNFQQARERTRDVQRKSDLKQLQNASEIYKDDQLTAFYPESGELEDELVPDYIRNFPTDPKEQKLSGSWTEYVYTRSDTSVLEYTLVACLENEGDVDRDEVNLCSEGVSYTLVQP
jgi:prepilin-type N-terminal cleavage/methylation domain-containing protein